MSKIILVFLSLFLVFSCGKKTVPVKPVEDFVQGSEDIPLLTGMEKIPIETLGFDTASGSIITSSYKLKNDISAAKKFYRETLPQMGWEILEDKKDKLILKREKEKLEIEFDRKNKIVKFLTSSSS